MQVRQAEPEQLGGMLLELLYDPAATPMFADLAWAVVRTLGRIVAVRHFETHGLIPSESYTNSLFMNSRSDIEQLERATTAIFDRDPAAIIPFIIDAYKLRATRNSIDEIMEQLDERPEAWAEKLGLRLLMPSEVRRHRESR